jgi:hypothetical protein
MVMTAYLLVASQTTVITVSKSDHIKLPKKYIAHTPLPSSGNPFRNPYQVEFLEVKRALSTYKIPVWKTRRELPSRDDIILYDVNRYALP